MLKQFQAKELLEQLESPCGPIESVKIRQCVRFLMQEAISKQGADIVDAIVARSVPVQWSQDAPHCKNISQLMEAMQKELQRDAANGATVTDWKKIHAFGWELMEAIEEQHLNKPKSSIIHA